MDWALILDWVKNTVADYDWGSPFTFIIVILAALAVMGKWSSFLLLLAIVVIGYGAQDMVITNIMTGNDLVSVPFIVYIVGGVILVGLFLISFFKS